MIMTFARLQLKYIKLFHKHIYLLFGLINAKVISTKSKNINVPSAQ